MSSFKYKTNRAKYRSDTKTLNEMHSDRIRNFQKKRQELPVMKHKYRKYVKTLQKLDKSEEHSVKAARLRSKLRTRIKSLEREIKTISTNRDKMKYYGRAHTVIKNYLQNRDGGYCETNSDDSDNEQDPTVTEGYSRRRSSDEDSDSDNENSGFGMARNKVSSELHKLCALKSKQKKIRKKSRRRDKGKKQAKSGSILGHLIGDGEAKVEEISNQATLKDRYRSLVDDNYIHSRERTVVVKTCSDCGNEMTAIPAEGSFVCQPCGVRVYSIMESEVPSHTDSLNEKPKYPYKKINHLIEKINQFQSKETNNVPPKIFDTVRKEMKKKRKTKRSITVGFVKKVLKKYKYNDYYENRQYIFSKITGTPPPVLTRDQEEEIKKRFRQLEEPFMKYRSPDRSNFLNYSFVLNKIFKIMGLNDHAKYFVLLKSPDKLKAQECTWKKICAYLDWPYHSNDDSNVRYKTKITDLYIDAE